MPTLTEKDSRIWNIALDCLEEMYQASVPSISFKELLNKCNQKEDYDKNYYQHHYLPKSLQDEIIQSYQDTYNLGDYFKESCDIIKEFLNQKHEIQYSNSEQNRIIPSLKETIGEEAAQKVEELIDECKMYFRIDASRNRNFIWTIFNYAPSTNKTTVEEYYKDKEYDFDDENIKNNYYNNF